MGPARGRVGRTCTGVPAFVMRAASRSTTVQVNRCFRGIRSWGDALCRNGSPNGSNRKNMLDRKRLKSKKISKTQSVTSQIDQGISDNDVHIGPSDHVPWLDDRKWAYIRVEGRNFGDVPLTVAKLEVWDSPNSAGMIIDALRCCKVAQDRGIGGALLGPSAYFMKSPPIQYRDEEARELVDEFARWAMRFALWPT